MTGNLATQDGELYYLPDFLPAHQAQALYGLLLDELMWMEETIRIMGREVKVPRKVCWYGDSGAVYQYSGTVHLPLPWTMSLLALKDAVEKVCGRSFNSVLGNYYRDGQDSMGWHADQEASLGRDPYIASVSLGAARRFKLRHNRTGESLSLLLAGGSLLLMGGSLQHHWRHCLPKTRKPVAGRVNLTFRHIVGG